jgi:hypothetical protein
MSVISCVIRAAFGIIPYTYMKKVLTRARTERPMENLYIKHGKVYYIYMQYKLIHTEHRSIVDSL